MKNLILNKWNNGRKGITIAFFVIAVLFAFYIIEYHTNVKGATAKSLPIVVFVDNQKINVQSVNTEPENILKDAGIDFFPEDKIQTELILNPIQEGGAGQKVILKRAPKISVTADGKVTVYRSWAKTVGEVLAEKNFSLGPKDIVTPSKETIVGNGSFVEVTRINEVQEDKEIVVPFETKFEKDYWTPAGQTKVKKAGVNGTKKQVFKVVFKNGKEVSRVLLSQTTVSSPVTQIVLKGVKPGNDKYGRWPLLVAAGTKYGVDPEEMYKVMICESKGYQYAGEYGDYKGIFQWDGSFYDWAKKAGYPNTDIFDVNAQAYATALRVSKYGWSAWGCKP